MKRLLILSKIYLSVTCLILSVNLSAELSNVDPSPTSKEKSFLNHSNQLFLSSISNYLPRITEINYNEQQHLSHNSYPKYWVKDEIINIIQENAQSGLTLYLLNEANGNVIKSINLLTPKKTQWLTSIYALASKEENKIIIQCNFNGSEDTATIFAINLSNLDKLKTVYSGRVDAISIQANKVVQLSLYSHKILLTLNNENLVIHSTHLPKDSNIYLGYSENVMSFYSSEKNQTLIQDFSKNTQWTINNFKPNLFIGYIGRNYYFIIEKKDIFYIVNIAKPTSLENPMLTELPEPLSIVTKIKNYFPLLSSVHLSFADLKKIDNTIIYRTFNGSQRFIEIFNLQTRENNIVPVPDGCLGLNETFTKTQEALYFKCTNALTGVEFSSHYNLTSESWKQSPNFLLNGKDISISIEYRNAISKDGTSIPYRIIQKQQGAATSLHSSAVLMEAYGGFGEITRHTQPHNDPFKKQFLINGGILVDAYIRGEGYYGPQWHQQAHRENKAKVIEDVIAVGQSLSQQKIVTPNRIILKGISHGGFVVASAGLMSANTFGLVVAINGIYDIRNLNKLDPYFNGYFEDFGNPKDPWFNKVSSQISPLELSKIDQLNNRTQFLLLNGQNDTRVNPLHSILLEKSFIKNGVTSNLFSSFHTGHGFYEHQIESKNRYNQAVMWAFIWKYLGWSIDTFDYGVQK